MTTISITNVAEPAMTEQIRSRIYFVLGSSMASLKVIEVSIESSDHNGAKPALFRCDLRVTETGGKWHAVSTQQQELGSAVEGSLSRLRRVLQRQHRIPG